MHTLGLETPVVASDKERELARVSSEKLARFHNKTLKVQLGSKGECVIPGSAIPLLAEVLSVMADGQAVTVVPVQTELTTQQAAEVLGVSRPFLIKLLDGGEIPHRLVGTHRRVLLKDVLEYRRQTDRNREIALDELVAEAQRRMALPFVLLRRIGHGGTYLVTRPEEIGLDFSPSLA